MSAIPKLDVPIIGLYVNPDGSTAMRRNGETPKPDGCVIKRTAFPDSPIWSIAHSDYRPIEKRSELVELTLTMKNPYMKVEILNVYGEYCVDGPCYSNIKNLIDHYNKSI